MTTAAGKYRLFVYGSLLEGERDHELLAGAEALGAARTEAAYSLVDLQIYPALVTGGTSAVVGELYLVDSKIRARADVSEQCPILFERLRIRLETGDEVEAYVMAADKVRGRRRIWNGDWRRRFAPKPRQSAAGPLVNWAKGRFNGR